MERTGRIPQTSPPSPLVAGDGSQRGRDTQSCRLDGLPPALVTHAADPLKQPEAYCARSALTFAGTITTPTLILHGEQHPCVPVNQAYAFHRALLERAVPTELVVYPREGHGLMERDHVRDMDERIVRWFEMYL